MIRGARRTKGRKPSARVSTLHRRARPASWLMRHAQVAVETLGRLSRSPLSTLMTAAVIGIAVALPASLHLLIKNVESLSGAWNDSASISLYLKTDVSDADADAFMQALNRETGIADLQLISRDQALLEFRSWSGFGEVLDLLDNNPLPAVILVQPDAQNSAPDRAQAMADRLGSQPQVDLAQLDLQWLRRLHAVTHMAERAVWVLAGLLAAAVLLVIGNTIRLEIQHRAAEIEITQLVGATNTFIRRPFLYTGLWYGFLGGLIAWVLITAGLWLLRGPVMQLAGLYESRFELFTQSPTILVALFIGSPLLGLAGARLAVGRQLARISPQ